ncbi:MAG: YdiY family protein [Erythrobacter sp.]
MKTAAWLRAAMAAGLALAFAPPAAAALPDPVRAMVDAAIAKGDAGKVRTVIEIARATNPDDAAELDTILKAFETRLAEAKAAEQAAKQAKIREAGVFDNWKGRAELGGFSATGNSSNSGLTASLAAERKGERWRHKLTGRADYQRANGVTNREQYLLRYEPNFDVSPNFYVYALGQYERDRFQGFAARYALSGGIGWQAVKNDKVQLAVKAGPAWRATEFTDGREENRIAALVGLDFAWNLTDRLKLTQGTNAVAEAGGAAIAILDARNTSIDLVTGLEAKISGKLSARVSYAWEYDSNPPPGAVGTDTLTRMTIVYGF